MGFGGDLYPIPLLTFAIMGLSLTLALTSSLVQRKFVDFEKVREMRSQMSELRKQMAEARKKGDKRTLAKLQRKQRLMMKDSSQVMGQQSKVMLLTTIPFLVIYWVLLRFIGTTVVAYSPVPIPYGAVGPDKTELTFWIWYFLSAISLNLPISRLFRTYTT
ncbi:EMC3/TMCO1 family protein [Candidatus Hecatella orcuttiae]|uniref:EMC3/TMCO1 family protein n=1 Tax=Candidatus Hecatella orcuttiae TaxID=1935119 RepID=UPI002867DF62|nr:EMC3/TMCO1 family protein [Candidatus Hecatella orcuttiae]